MSTERPSAELGGQPPSWSQHHSKEGDGSTWNALPDVRGLQLVNVWAEVGVDKVMNATIAAVAVLKREICIA